MKEKRCEIPANGGMVGFAKCEKEWGHAGDLHATGGDGFYNQAQENEHHRRQKERLKRGGAPKL